MVVGRADVSRELVVHLEVVEAIHVQVKDTFRKSCVAADGFEEGPVDLIEAFVNVGGTTCEWGIGDPVILE